jgi:putative membrane protein
VEILDGLVVTVAKRPYVFAFLAAYAFAATRHLGGRRVLALTAIGWLVAWSSEASSIRNGFPYGLYRYLVGPGGIDPREPRVAGVPLFDSISYVFLAYASYCVALVALGVRDVAGRRGPGVAVAGAAIFCAVDTIVDPVALRGSRWFLGQIYDYPGGGSHFGVPVSNYGGWLLVGFLILFLFQRADARLAPPPAEPRGGPLLGTLIYFGVVGMNVGIAFWIGEPTIGIASCCTALPIAGVALARAFPSRV